MTLYICANGAMVTTAALPSITTGTAIKTMLQVQTSATDQLKVVEWGISFDGSSAAVPIKCELIDTAAIAATTLTAHVAAGVQPYDNPLAPASSVALGTGATGYAGSPTEGTIVASRYADVQLVAPTGQYIKQWPLGREFQMNVSRNLRVRVTAPVAVNCFTYIIWEE